ncbi:hypothetical protein [Dysgonomonas sp. ZJ709]|nr:hypothetical protein [Dysgonomonas sp. ZJ709]
MIKERIIQIIEDKGLAKEEFFARIGMTSANFRGKAKGTPLNSNAIENILLVLPDINLEWLLTGNGKAYKESSTKNSSVGIVSETKTPQYGSDYKDKYILQLEKENERLRKDIEDKEILINAFRTGLIVYTDVHDGAKDEE